MEKPHLSNFKIYFDRLNGGVVVDQGTSEQIIYLYLPAFKSYDQKLIVAVRSGELRLLLFDFHAVSILAP